MAEVVDSAISNSHRQEKEENFNDSLFIVSIKKKVIDSIRTLTKMIY